MRKKKRMLSIIIAMCFIVNSFSAITVEAFESKEYQLTNGFSVIDITTTEHPTATLTFFSEPTVSLTSAAPEATPTAAPTAAPEATPTAAPEATPTAAPTATPEATPTAAPEATPTAAPTATPEATPTAAPKPTIKPTPKPTPLNTEKLWYSKKIPMKKEYQKTLWDYCKKRKLDYINMLSLISTESNFHEKSSNGTCRGYFQIHECHYASLSKTLKTANKPLDGKININWGTALFSWILSDKRVKNLKGKRKYDVALSIYLRGTGGYDRNGISHSYLNAFYKRKSTVLSYFKKK